MKRILWMVLLLTVVGFAAWGPIVSDVEQAQYTVEKTEGKFELRRYEPMIVAETTVKGERKAAINQGFRTIADYIFGNNTTAAKVEMTAPVTQQSEKIPMTAPVIQQGSGDEWKVRFVMPASYTLATLPKPNNKEVRLRVTPAKRFAVVRFSGVAGEQSIAKNTETLMAAVTEQKLRALAAPTLAFYNPPWTLPFLRRNEVMVEIAR